MESEIGRGAEAVLTVEDGVVRKLRLPKSYRVPELDEQIRHERTVREARIISEARRCGVATPIIMDLSRFEIMMEYIGGVRLKEVVTPELSRQVGVMVGRLHRCGIVHGDLTTSNIMRYRERLYLIDFGLAYHDWGIEAQGVDVHVYFQTLISTHDRAQELISAFQEGYLQSYEKAKEVLARVEEIKARGRYL
ncbi:MAG: Kae1-associated kinase Bud32 [Methanosarcinales archaeon]|nr:Kae1-associated kinase Bud32 [Methanosarcinales archaeon]